MSKVELHFDFVEIGNDIEVGFAAIEEDEVLGSGVKTYENAKVLTKGNNFHFTLTAWRDAVRYLIKLVAQEGIEIERLTFCNQNGLIFKWATSGECDETYAKILSQVMTSTDSLSDVCGGLALGFKKIAGKDNQVKKLLKKRKSMREVEEESFNFAPITPKAPKKSWGNWNSEKRAEGSGSGLVESTLSEPMMRKGSDNVIDISSYSFERMRKAD